MVWIDANSVEHGCHTQPKAKSCSLGLIIHTVYMILKILVVVSWQLSKQHICWPVSCDHITSSGFELIKDTCFFWKGWLLTNYWFLLGLWTQVRLICKSALGCSEGIILLLLCYVVWDCWNSKPKSKQYMYLVNRKPHCNVKTQIKILPYPGLA